MRWLELLLRDAAQSRTTIVPRQAADPCVVCVAVGTCLQGNAGISLVRLEVEGATRSSASVGHGFLPCGGTLLDVANELPMPHSDARAHKVAMPAFSNWAQSFEHSKEISN